MPKQHKTTEVVISANRRHRGIVTLVSVGRDHKGALVAKNGIKWHVPSR